MLLEAFTDLGNSRLQTVTTGLWCESIGNSSISGVQGSHFLSLFDFTFSLLLTILAVKGE